MNKLKKSVKGFYFILYKIKSKFSNPRFYKFLFLRILNPGVINSKYRRNVSSMFFYNTSIFQWFKDEADYLLYQHKLNINSLVIDAGAYHGNWCEKIFKTYQCEIYAFEPVKEHFTILKNRIKKYNKIKAYNFGLGKNNEKIGVELKGIQTTSLDKVEFPDEIIEIKDVRELNEFQNKNIDLFHINIEGGEYELIEAIVSSKLIENIESLEVQFHEWYPTMEKSKVLRSKLHISLMKTHELIYSYDFVWEKWSKKIKL